MTEVLILLVLIILNGLFVMSEIALVSARKSRLESAANKGDQRARIALNLAENPDIFLSAAQIGITVIAILTGFYSAERFNVLLQPTIEKIPALRPYAPSIATGVIVIIVTFLTILFGELLPKRIGMIYAESLAKTVAVPMRFFAKATHPIVWVLTKTSNFFFRLFRINVAKDNSMTEEEIKAIINEGTEQGTIQEAEQEIIERVFHLTDRNITSLMTHRSDIIWFDVNDNEQSIKEKILHEPHSAYPICDGQIDNIKGLVSIKDLYISDDLVLFKDIMKTPIFVPENNSAYQVIEKFKETQIHSCFIIDEYGSLLGMITLNDILNAIVGDIPDQALTDYEIVEREDGSYLVDAQIPFYDFLTRFEKTAWINEEDQDFNTLAGFVLYEIERIPVIGDKLEWRGFNFEILDMDAQRIDKVLVSIPEDVKNQIEE